MKVAATITPAEWMTDADSTAVLQALNGQAGEPQALFVGGCVRNLLLGRAVTDIDIATVHPPHEVEALLAAAGIRTVPTGIDHGTVTAILPGRSFEITTLRRDVATDGRRAVVAFSDSWLEDAQRRDFTMNTLLAAPDGSIYDPTGKGVQDLEAGRVVFVGDPATRIAEDYLRILRFFRFYAIYGAGAPDEVALAACGAAADKIATLSKERITQEILKLLAASNAAPVMGLMFSRGVMTDLAGPDWAENVLQRLIEAQESCECPDIPARLLAVTGTVERAEQTLILSNKMKRAMYAITSAEITGKDDRAVKRLVYRQGRETAIQALILDAARRDEPAAFQTALAWDPPSFPLKGDDILQAGAKQGPQVAELLTAIEEWWMEEDFAPGRDACLARLKELTA